MGRRFRFLSRKTIFSRYCVVAAGVLFLVGTETVSVNRMDAFTEAALSQTMPLMEALHESAQTVLGNVFRLTRVELEGVYHADTDALLKRAGFDRRPWLWQLSSRVIAAKLRSEPWIEKVSLRWQFLPLALTVLICEHEPWFIAEMGEDTWLVSRAGTQVANLSALDDPDLIIESSRLARVDGIGGIGEDTAGTANARFQYAVRVMTLLDAAGGMPFSADRYSVLPHGGLLVQPKDVGKDPQVLVQVESFSQAREALNRLRAALDDLQRRGEAAETLDLRFAGQVVVTPALGLVKPANAKGNAGRA